MAYYAVKKGRVPGIYMTWDECKLQTDKFSGAIFKKFALLEEAKKFLQEVKEEIQRDFEYQLFVDGGYDKNKHVASYAAVLVHNGIVIEKKSGILTDERFLESRNVYGELIAVLEGLKMISRHNIESVQICYDYEGIQKFFTGEWIANKAISKYFVLNSTLYKNIEVSFCKIMAHTGNEFNEYADKLCTQELITYNPDRIKEQIKDPVSVICNWG